MTTNPHNISKKVIEKIKSGEVHMRSKYIFIAKITALIALAVLTLAVSAFLLSFIIFSLHISGKLLLLGFGFRGIGAFIRTFPWILFLIDLGLIAGLQRLIKRFEFGYRNPFIYVISGIITVSILAGFFIEQTPFHHLLLHRAQMNHERSAPNTASFVDSVYKDTPIPPHEEGAFRGTIVSLDDHFFIMETGNENLIQKVVVPPDIIVRGVMSVGDAVFVAGDIRSDGTIFAYGIQKLATSSEDGVY